MTRSLYRSHVAAILILTLATTLLLPATFAGTTASLGGRVLAEGSTPVAGVTVRLVADETYDIVGSSATDDEGTFNVESAPTGTYRVLVETDQGAFLAPSPISLAPGVNTPIAVNIRNEDKRDFGFGSDQGPGLPTWGKWLIGGAAGVVALFLISEIGDEEPASVFE